VVGLVRGAGAHGRLTWPTEMGERFPPLPAVLSAVTDQAGFLPGPSLIITSTRAVGAATDQGLARRVILGEKFLAVCGDLDRGPDDTAQVLKYAPA